jgi:hypothetical protein
MRLTASEGTFAETPETGTLQDSSPKMKTIRCCAHPPGVGKELE